MHGEIIAIGDELVSGKVLNTTANFAANKLFAAGCQVTRITSIGDDPDDIEECLLAAIKRSEYVIITGGLGPTTDDITNGAVANALGLSLVLNEKILEKIRKAERKRGLEPSPLREKLAWLPDGAEVLNPHGHAAGYLLIHEDIPLFFLPGVPDQLKDHMIHRVIPILKRLVAKRFTVRQRTFKVFGLSEMETNPLLEKLESSRDSLTIGYYPNFPEVDITLTVKDMEPEKADHVFLTACETIEKLLDKYIIALDDDTLEVIVGRLLIENLAILALAESCTGGLLGQRITSIAGSSEWFERGVIAYSNKSKQDILGVSPETLSSYGAVSFQTAEEMVNGVKSLSGANYAIAVTGIAGPSGGTLQRPVGTVYIALATPERTVVEQFYFPGTRQMIRALAAETALDWLRRYLTYATYIPCHRYRKPTA